MVTRRRRPPHFRRVPYAPLHDYLAARWANDYRASFQADDGRLVDGRVADLCGVSRTVAQRWRSSGAVTLRAADRAAVHLGVHVLDIWPDFHADIDTTREECA